MNRLICLVILPLLLVGCTLSFSIVDTHGTATDLIDEEQTATPNVSPTVNVPAM
jgi:hypothetical protein